MSESVTTHQQESDPWLTLSLSVGAPPPTTATCPTSMPRQQTVSAETREKRIKRQKMNNPLNTAKQRIGRTERSNDDRAVNTLWEGWSDGRQWPMGHLRIMSCLDSRSRNSSRYAKFLQQPLLGPGASFRWVASYRQSLLIPHCEALSKQSSMKILFEMVKETDDATGAVLYRFSKIKMFWQRKLKDRDPVFFRPNILCVHVRKLGTSVRKSTTRSDLQNLQNRCCLGRTRRSFVIHRRQYESEVTDFVPSQALCMHAIAIKAWSSGYWRF